MNIQLLEIISTLYILLNGETGVFLTQKNVPLPIISVSSAGALVKTPCLEEKIIPLDKGIFINSVDIIIDPGHGGRNTGAVTSSGLVERDLNLVIAKKLKEKLDAANFFTLLTRNTEKSSRLGSRISITNILKPKIFVSIHHNDSPQKKISFTPGTQIFYQYKNDKSKRLGGLIFQELLPTLSKIGTKSRYWWSEKDTGVIYRLNTRGTDYYGLLRNIKYTPSVLVEVAYITNKEEEAILIKSKNQDKIAEAIYTGILHFFENDIQQGVGFAKPVSPVYSDTSTSGSYTSCQEQELY